MKTKSRIFLASILPVFLLAFLASGQKPLNEQKEQLRISKNNSQTPPRMPRAFEENKGQAETGVKFLSRGKDFNLFLTSDGKAVYQLPGPGCEKQMNEKAGFRPQKSRPCRMISLGMKMLAANRETRISGIDELPTKTGYFTGNDESRWQRGISNFQAVRYQNIYDGIDVVFRGSEQNLEYDFHVAPKSNPALIGLEFDGATKVKIARSGDLVFKFDGLEITHQKPLAYQIIDGERKEVSAKFVLSGENKIGFVVGAYDTGKALIIDPVVYATYLGGTAGGDSINDIAVDGETVISILLPMQEFPFPQPIRHTAIF